ncbi:MAG: hypothetical protein QNJ33_19415 [Crocosphaera sp.]|nr:hypothetical protein [Crocosphaera sp.]
MHSTQSDSQIPKHLDKIFFSVASVYFLLALMWVFSDLSEQKQRKTAKSTPNPTDAEFIAYLQQSLNVINQPSTSKTLVNPQEKKPSNVAIQSTSPSTPEKVIERIYVPMYPPNPSNPTPPSLQPPSPPTPPVPSANSTPSRVPVLTPNQNTFSVPPEIAASPQLSQDTGHQLVGVLESGEQSTAIFTFNGLSRRFEIGEAVGSSGGILMGVQNQKAIIYHNGQTKYVEVGQGF